jgi:alcohol dehydrogenase (NADP+)
MAASNICIRFPSGDEMPIIGLGTRSIAESDVQRAVETAIAIGYRHVDCGATYQSERAVGLAIKDKITAGVITRGDVFVTAVLPWHASRRHHAQEFLEQSLDNLQLDYVDLYLIQFPLGIQFSGADCTSTSDGAGKYIVDRNTNIENLWKGMESVIDCGLAKNIGVANFNSSQIQRILDNCRFRPSVLQVECHLYLQQRLLTDYCNQERVTVAAFGPLGSAGQPEALDDPIVMSIAHKHCKTPAQVLLRFLIQRGISVLPNSSNPAHIQENFDVFDFRLEGADMQALQTLDMGYRNFTFDNDEEVRRHCEYPFYLPF